MTNIQENKNKRKPLRNRTEKEEKYIEKRLSGYTPPQAYNVTYDDRGGKEYSRKKTSYKVENREEVKLPIERARQELGDRLTDCLEKISFGKEQAVNILIEIAKKGAYDRDKIKALEVIASWAGWNAPKIENIQNNLIIESPRPLNEVIADIRALGIGTQLSDEQGGIAEYPINPPGAKDGQSDN